jgi:hypothetical protein
VREAEVWRHGGRRANVLGCRGGSTHHRIPQSRQLASKRAASVPGTAPVTRQPLLQPPPLPWLTAAQESAHVPMRVGAPGRGPGPATARGPGKGPGPATAREAGTGPGRARVPA